MNWRRQQKGFSLLTAISHKDIQKLTGVDYKKMFYCYGKSNPTQRRYRKKLTKQDNKKVFHLTAILHKEGIEKMNWKRQQKDISLLY